MALAVGPFIYKFNTWIEEQPQIDAAKVERERRRNITGILSSINKSLLKKGNPILCE